MLARWLIVVKVRSMCPVSSKKLASGPRKRFLAPKFARRPALSQPVREEGVVDGKVNCRGRPGLRT